MKNIIRSLTFHHEALFLFPYRKNILKTAEYLTHTARQTQVRQITLMMTLLHSGHSATINVISDTCVCRAWFSLRLLGNKESGSKRKGRVFT